MNGDRHHPSQPYDDELLLSVQRHECPRCGKQCRKPLIRVVCPVCAKIVVVNALDREGEVSTLCSKCPKTMISITTDESGCITAIDAWPEAVEEKPKTTDWRLIAVGIVVVLVLLLWIGSGLRSSGESEKPAPQAPVAGRQSSSQPEGGAAGEQGSSNSANRLFTVSEAETKAEPKVSTSPPTPDMFEPEKD